MLSWLKHLAWHVWLDAAGAGLAVIGLASIGYGVWQSQRPVLPVPHVHALVSVPATQNAVPSLPASKPLRIDVPAIGVHALLAYTGLNADGSPGVPAGSYVDNPSWLTTSAMPGTVGTAIIIGHVDTARSGPSVFYNLAKLTPGDTVAIRRQDNRTAIFTINAVQVYSKDAFPSALVYDRSATPTLRLITCTGSWDAAAGRYTQNLVIFAALTATH